MSINITDKPEMNVVNVGEELTTDQLAAIQNASNPSSSNPLATIADIGGGGGGSVTNPITFTVPSNWDVNETVTVNFRNDGGSGFIDASSTGIWTNNFHLGYDGMFANYSVDGSYQSQMQFQSYGITAQETTNGELRAFYYLQNNPNNQPEIAVQHMSPAGFNYRISMSPYGIQFPDGTTQTTAYTGGGGGGGGNPFDQTLNTTDNVTFNQLNFSNGTSLAKGTFDNGLGGSNGISLNCAVGYELNWQGGQLKVTTDGGVTSSPLVLKGDLQIFPQSGGGLMEFYVNDTDGIKTLSPFDGTFSKLYSSALRFYDSGGNQLLELSGYYLTLPQGVSSGIVFGDGTTQATAYAGGPVVNSGGGSQFSTGLWMTTDGSPFPVSSIGGFWSATGNAGVVVEQNGGLSLIDNSANTSLYFTTYGVTSSSGSFSVTDYNGYEWKIDATNNSIQLLYNMQSSVALGPNLLRTGGQNVTDLTEITSTGVKFFKNYDSNIPGYVKQDELNHIAATTGTSINGNQNHISTDDYPDEVVITINGVDYAVPARNLTGGL